MLILGELNSRKNEETLMLSLSLDFSVARKQKRKTYRSFVLLFFSLKLAAVVLFPL
jgi:hypothetical protein